jgi:serine/threonine-protein kinase HipA
MAKAKALWPAALSELPMADEHKLKLTEHWQNLSADFKIGD